jgi:hypothetical protein
MTNYLRDQTTGTFQAYNLSLVSICRCENTRYRCAVFIRHCFPNLMNIPVEARTRTVMSAKVNMTLCSPTLVTQGVRAKTKMVEMTLRVNVTPTTASAMIYNDVSRGVQTEEQGTHVGVRVGKVGQSDTTHGRHGEREHAHPNSHDGPGKPQTKTVTEH